MNDVSYWSFSSNNVNGNVSLKLQQRQMKETAHLVIGEEPMRLSTKEIIVPDSKHRRDDRHLFVEIL